jgi:hypothetical protein
MVSYTSCAEARPITKGSTPSPGCLPAADAPATTPWRDRLNTGAKVAGPGRELPRRIHV